MAGGYLDYNGLNLFKDKINAELVNPVINLSALAFQCAYPTNRLILDDKGKPGAYVYIPKFRLCDVLSTGDTTTHPAFIVNGSEIPGFYIGKYQSHIYDERAYSLPAEDPSVDMALDQAAKYNRNKGGNFHEVTAAEWAAIALWCHKNGTEPNGNNNYGKDHTETIYKAAPMSYDSSGRIGRVSTGTGPITWSHDGTQEGIWDLNGNVWELCVGLRLIHGEVQAIPNNNAADPICDTSASSAAWKAIKADATSWDDLFVTPDGNGTTQGTVKLDWINGVGGYNTVITNAVNGSACIFRKVTADTSIGDRAKLFLMALAILPDTALIEEGIATDYKEDRFWVDNVSAERIFTRGGSWDGSYRAGVFQSSFGDSRSGFRASLGSRSAYID